MQLILWAHSLPGNRALLFAEIAGRLAAGSGFPAVFEEVLDVVPSCYHRGLKALAANVRAVPDKPLLEHFESSDLFVEWELRFVRFGLASGRVVEVFARICDHHTILASAGRSLFFGFWILWLGVTLLLPFILLIPGGTTSGDHLAALGILHAVLLLLGLPVYTWLVQSWIRPDARVWRALNFLPLFRQTQGSRSLYHYLLNLGLCIQAGLHLRRALSLSADAETTAVLREKYKLVSADVTLGHPLSTAFQRSGVLQDTLLMVNASQLKKSKLWEPGVTDVVKASYSELLKRTRPAILAIVAVGGLMLVTAGHYLIYQILR